MNMAWFFSLCSSLFFLSLLSFFTHKLRHTDFPLVRINVPLLWVSVNFCIHCHNYIFKSQLFSVSLTFKKNEKLISALLWCRHWSTGESCWVSLCEDMKVMNTSVTGALFFCTSSHTLTQTCPDPVLIFYGVTLHQHSLWKKPLIAPDLYLPGIFGLWLHPHLNIFCSTMAKVQHKKTLAPHLGYPVITKVIWGTSTRQRAHDNAKHFDKCLNRDCWWVREPPQK